MVQRESNETTPARPDADTARPFSRRKKILAWVWVVCWALLIWILGSDSFSITETDHTILPWLDWLTGDLDYRTRYRIYVAIRKSAHFIEYAILAGLTFRASLIAASRRRASTAAWAALFIVVSLATADEARQTFSAVRSGSPYDVLIDVTGGLLMVLGLVMITRRLRPSGTAESSA